MQTAKTDNTTTVIGSTKYSGVRYLLNRAGSRRRSTNRQTIARMYQIRAVSVDTSTATPMASSNQSLATTKPAVIRLHTSKRRHRRAARGVDPAQDQRQVAGPAQCERLAAGAVDHAVIAGDHAEQGDDPEAIEEQGRFARRG